MVGNISLGERAGTGTEIPKLMPFEIERKPFLRQRLMKQIEENWSVGTQQP